MRKLLVLLMVLVVSTMAVWGAANVPVGPAPNAGDGVSDGSGIDAPVGPSVGVGDAFGPAPNAGNGVSDGSGLEPLSGIL